MSDHTPQLFNVFEDWNDESVVPHISFASFVFNLNASGRFTDPWCTAVYTADLIRDLIRM